MLVDKYGLISKSEQENLGGLWEPTGNVCPSSELAEAGMETGLISEPLQLPEYLFDREHIATYRVGGKAFPQGG